MLLLVGYSCLGADGDPFVGTWIQKVELSRSYPENTRTFETDGKTLIETSVLSNPHEYILDGIAHPVKRTEGATDISETPTPGVFTHRIFRDGKPWSESKWEVAPDGKTMLVTTAYHNGLNGDSTLLSTYDRISGSNGLNGSWKPRKDEHHLPETVVIGQSEEGLVVTRGWGRSWIVDGKPRVGDPRGASPEAKTTVSKVASNLIERRTVTNGKTTFLTRMEIGSDGKTLTQTDEWTSGNGTLIRSVSVYTKQ